MTSIVFHPVPSKISSGISIPKSFIAVIVSGVRTRSFNLSTFVIVSGFQEPSAFIKPFSTSFAFKLSAAVPPAAINASIEA